MAKFPKMTPPTNPTNPVVDSVNALHKTMKDLVGVQKSFFRAFSYLKKELTGKIAKTETGRFKNIRTGRFASKEEFELQEKEFKKEQDEIQKKKKLQQQKRKTQENKEETERGKSSSPFRLGGPPSTDIIEDLVDGVWELVDEIQEKKTGKPLRLGGSILDASYRVEERTLTPLRRVGVKDLPAEMPRGGGPVRLAKPPYIDAVWREIEDLKALPDLTDATESRKAKSRPKKSTDHLASIAKDVRTIRVSIDDIKGNISSIRKINEKTHSATLKINENISFIRKTGLKSQKVQKAEKDKEKREKKPKIKEEKKKKETLKAKEQPPAKGLGGMLADFFGFTDLFKMFKPLTGIVGSAITGIFSFIPKIVSGLMPLMTGILKSLFGGPLGIIASIGFLINDFFKGLDIADALGVSNVSGVIGSIFGGDLVGGMINAFKNAGTWAIMGATIGSAVPVVGTLAGGIVGAALGAVLGWIGGGQIAIWMEQIGTTIANWWDATVAELFDVKDMFANAKDKFHKVTNTAFSSIVAGILDFIGNLFSILANIEIPIMNLVPKTLQKFIPDFVLDSIPKTAKPFGFLEGASETVRTSASNIRASSEAANEEIDKQIAQREVVSEERQKELDLTEAKRAQRIQDASDELERLKAEELKGPTPGETVPSLTPSSPFMGKMIDTMSKGIQAGKEMMGGGGSNVIAPVTNNVVTTKGPTNNIIQGMPNTRPTESSWIRCQNKNYVPS